LKGEMLLDLDFAEIYFGDNEFQINIEGADKKLPLLLEQLMTEVNAKKLLFLNQTHGIDFTIIDENFIFETSINFRKIDGDIIITNQRNIAIGVLTADCLPVVILDKKNKVVAVVHSGWKGSVLNANAIAIQQMRKQFGTQLNDLQIYFGPAAKNCCYEVQQDFIEKNKTLSIEKFLINRDKKIFFDLIDFNKKNLYKIGILEKQINDSNCFCTICDTIFCSFRREKDFYRQATIVALK